MTISHIYRKQGILSNKKSSRKMLFRGHAFRPACRTEPHTLSLIPDRISKQGQPHQLSRALQPLRIDQSTDKRGETQEFQSSCGLDDSRP
jgi:hypothetical protein